MGNVGFKKTLLKEQQKKLINFGLITSELKKVEKQECFTLIYIKGVIYIIVPESIGRFAAFKNY